jgi:hypothetical protein
MIAAQPGGNYPCWDALIFTTTAASHTDQTGKEKVDASMRMLDDVTHMPTLRTMVPFHAQSPRLRQLAHQ